MLVTTQDNVVASTSPLNPLSINGEGTYTTIEGSLAPPLCCGEGAGGEMSLKNALHAIL